MVHIDYHQVEKRIKADYRQATRQYRLDDEIEVTTENHLRLGARLREICRSFPHPIEVLEVGCGTGRFFHCVENASRLVGLDVSEDMLQAARNPVLASEIATPRIELVQGNAYLADFPPGSFHFIYSLGMFGHGCPVTPQVCEKFYDWLAPGGKLFFDTIDFAGLPRCYRMRRRVKSLLYPFLTPQMRQRLDQRENKSPFFWMTTRQLQKLLKSSRFARFRIESHLCTSPLWNGRHLECFAERA